MNKIYKLKFDKRRNELVVVSEITTGMGKDKCTGHIAGVESISPFRKYLGVLKPLSLLTSMLLGMLPAMTFAAELPVGGTVVGGQGSITTSGNQMTIHQQTQQLATDWHSFDIGRNHTVEFIQPDSSALALNRVTGASGSQIMGTLKANGQVFILNPNGIVFGKDARVNVAGLLASTKNINVGEFMQGKVNLQGGSSDAWLINQGSLTTAPGGYIVLAGNQVKNSGTITTPAGKTVLASAEKITLQLDNGGLASVTVNGSVVNSLIENQGLISATDGQVYLTARAKDMLLNTVINNTGIIEARGLSHQGGEIVLNGGDSGVVRQDGTLLADSSHHSGGKITVEGENIHLTARSKTHAMGHTGGGEVYVGGGWQGRDSAIKNASKVVMDKGATIDVSAIEQGNGGRAVLWSEDYTNFRGTVFAHGGKNGGNGGQVETSSHQNLQVFGEVDASAANGKGGEWLLDPTDVSIVGSGADIGTSNTSGVFTPTASGAQILNTSINNQLNNGTSVTVKTSGNNVDGHWGNITVNAGINKTAGGNASLALEADGMLNVAANISSIAGKLDVALKAAGSNNGTISINSKTISTNGGNISLGQLNYSTSNQHVLSVLMNNSSLNTTQNGGTSGNINIYAYDAGVSVSNNPLVTLSNSVINTNDFNLLVDSSQKVGVSVAKLTNVTLNAGNNVSINATGSAPAKGRMFEIYGSNITSRSIDFEVHSLENSSGAGTVPTVLQIGNSKLNAIDSINMNVSAGFGGSGRAIALNIERSNLHTKDLKLMGRGEASSASSVSISGIRFQDSTINVSERADIFGVTNGKSTTLYEGGPGVALIGNLNFSGGAVFNINGDGGEHSNGVRGTGVNISVSADSVVNINATSNMSRSDVSGHDNYKYVYASAINFIDANTDGPANLGISGGGKVNFNAKSGGEAQGIVVGNVNVTGSTTTVNLNGTASGADTSGVVIWGIKSEGHLNIEGRAENAAGVRVADIYSNGTVTNNKTLSVSAINGGSVNICGTSNNSDGVYLNKVDITDISVQGHSSASKGINVSSNSNVLNSTLTGTSKSGTGVYTTDASTVNGSTITGNSANGTGVELAGNVSNSNVTGQGNTAGVNVSGNVTNGTVNGTSAEGTGVAVSGNTTLSNVAVSGNTTNGTG
ncbi:filamentous hemagglutinin N-terminal domain-containing protein, partial [Salmonella enterica]|nr:filamentous hemagglutinin N-terminal domain-containing protein [Salmonella enterica]